LAHADSTLSADTAAAGGYLPVIGVLSFLLWYRPIYLGLDRTEGKAMAFFFCERGGYFRTFPTLLLSTIRNIRDTMVYGLYRFRQCALTRLDIYFLFAGFNLLFAIYMAIGIPCTCLPPAHICPATSRTHSWKIRAVFCAQVDVLGRADLSRSHGVRRTDQHHLDVL
jgi:hypothetical protein